MGFDYINVEVSLQLPEEGSEKPACLLSLNPLAANDNANSGTCTREMKYAEFIGEAQKLGLLEPNCNYLTILQSAKGQYESPDNESFRAFTASRIPLKDNDKDNDNDNDKDKETFVLFAAIVWYCANFFPEAAPEADKATLPKNIGYNNYLIGQKIRYHKNENENENENDNNYIVSLKAPEEMKTADASPPYVLFYKKPIEASKQSDHTNNFHLDMFTAVCAGITAVCAGITAFCAGIKKALACIWEVIKEAPARIYSASTGFFTSIYAKLTAFCAFCTQIKESFTRLTDSCSPSSSKGMGGLEEDEPCVVAKDNNINARVGI